MLGTDRYAYRSPLKRVDPVSKLIIATVVMILCIALNQWYISVFTFVSMVGMNCYFGKNKLSDIGHMLYLPLGFILLGTLTILVSRYPSSQDMLWALPVGQYFFGTTKEGLFRGFEIIAKSFGVIASVYFLVMNTPMTDLSIALERLRVPQLFTELMELVYRFIFVLWDSAQRIRVAQNSRLGYKDLRTAYRSTGEIGARLFVESMKRSDKIFNALESRGYQGKIETIGMSYEQCRPMIYGGMVIVLLQLASYMIGVL